MENRQIAAVGGIILLIVISILFIVNSSQKKTDNTNTPLNLNFPTQPPTQSQESQSPTPAPVTELKIEDEKVGTGSAVKSGDTITVNYKGTLLNGQTFDSSYDRNQPFTTQIGVGHVIEGWDEGLIGMQVGGIRKLTIPASLGYGDQAQGPIPANSPLIFEIELLDVK